MKKLLTFVLALSMVASTCLYAQAVKKNKPKADEPETLLFYGCSLWDVEDIRFIQTDTKLAPSFIKYRGDNYYYGEVASGGSCKCTYWRIFNYDNNTIYYSYCGLSLPNNFDFVLPKEKDKIIYLGFKNYDGAEATEEIYKDALLKRNKSPEKKAKLLKEDELASRGRAVYSMLRKYRKTKWEPLLKEELEKVENLQKKLKKGEDLGDEE
ncbi:MAG: hypothetical protein II103_10335 [Treponema sp.]|nr:hypothetical protein [Treponema sp.]